jgi:MFS family permease
LIGPARPATDPVGEPATDPAGATHSDQDPSDTPPGVVGLWALFLGLGLMMIGNGLNGSLVGLRSGAEGFSLTVTGVIMAGYFAGFLLGPTAVVQMIPKVGHIRVFAGLASTASSAVLVHALIVDPVVWMGLRFVFGFCMAGLYVVIESWLNEMSSSVNRGRTLAVYMLVTMGGMVIGQLLLGIGDSNGFQLFILASILVSLSLVPMTLAATTKQPPVRMPARTSVRELLGYVPTGAVGSFMVGACTGALLGLGAVYASSVGMSIERTSIFLAAPLIGAIIFQWPVGWVSDRVSRRFVIFVVANVAGAAATTLAIVSSDSAIVIPLMVLFGGANFSLYSLVVAYTLDWTPVDKTVAASGTLVRINGTGAILGPLIGAGLMAAFDPTMYFWTMVGTQTVIVVYVGYRLLAKDAMPLERQRLFVLIPARASEFVVRMAPKPRRRPKPPKS